MIMKRILTILALAAAVIAAASCEKEGNKDGQPTIQFSRSLYQLYTAASVDVSVQISSPATEDLSIPLAFGGTATIDEDYSVSSSAITIPAGESTGSITVTYIAMEEGEEINITMASIPEGYAEGSRRSAIVSYVAQEAIIYSFEYESGDLLDRYIVNISLTGATSQEDYVFDTETVVPVSVTGEGASLINIENDGFVFNAGESTGRLTMTINDDSFAGNVPATISVADDRYVGGNVPSMTIYVKGILTPETILGTWEFDEMINLDELELWFEEMWDDPTLLPTHNEGFTLTFGGSEGSYTITPGGEGDFMNYYRETAISHTAPVNPVSGSITLGAYTSDEAQMFTAEVDTPRQQITYFRLAEVNRAFSAETETIGEGTIAMRLRNDGKLEIYIKDYDQPPFGEMWWDGFDPDMFSFAATFTKAE